MSAAAPHRLLPTLVAAAAVAVVAGCGPGAILTAETPDQAVSSALQAVRTTPLRASLTGDLPLDTSSLTNLPASIQTILGQVGSGGSATGQLDQESSARRQLTVERRRQHPDPGRVRRPRLRQPRRRRVTRSSPQTAAVQPRRRPVRRSPPRSRR